MVLSSDGDCQSALLALVRPAVGRLSRGVTDAYRNRRPQRCFSTRYVCRWKLYRTVSSLWNRLVLDGRLGNAVQCFMYNYFLLYSSLFIGPVGNIFRSYYMYFMTVIVMLGAVFIFTWFDVYFRIFAVCCNKPCDLRMCLCSITHYKYKIICCRI